MKSSLSILILFAIVSIAILGAFSMGFMGEHSQGCWASVANGVACPESMSPLASIDFHSNAFAKFSLAVFQNTFLLVLLMAALLIVAKVILLKEIPIFGRFRFANAVSKLNRHKFTRWLSLLENSPSYLNRA